MPNYRAYIVGDDGHFSGVEHMVCANDETAIEAAKKLVERHNLEVWTGARRVALLMAAKK